MSLFTSRITEGAACPPFEMVGNLLSPSVMAAPEELPDARIFLTNSEGTVTAHAAVWWKDTPFHGGKKIGAIGGFQASDAEAASALLKAACDFLKVQGVRTAVGPMNGNTWRRHRYIIESNGRGAYFLEPGNAGSDPEWWLQAGFGELSRYSSSRIPLDEAEPTSEALKKRLEKSGVVIRLLDSSRFEDELKAIHRVSVKSFSHNFLYTELEEKAFVASYQKVKKWADPLFVRIAERHGEICGFVFAIPDLEAMQRGEKPALIVKTLAVDPESRCAGLGSLLVNEVHQAARENGYTEAIHAMQHDSNSSRKITDRSHGEIFRRYALYSKGP